MRGHVGRRPREEIVYERDLRLITQAVRVAFRYDPFGDLVQHDASAGYKKNAREFVGHNDDGDAEVAAEGDDEVVEFDRGDRV